MSPLEAFGNRQQSNRTWYVALAVIAVFVVAAHLYVVIKAGPWC